MTRELTSMENTLIFYGMTLLNSDILVCGGLPITSNCMLYGSVANIWTTFPPLPMAIAALPMITLNNNQPYVFGGQDMNYNVLNTVYSFDTTNAWTLRTPMVQPLKYHTAVAIDTNTAMVCGGVATNNFNSTQSQCYKYTICICGVYNFSRIILVGLY
jgi:hypothetical protein